MSHRFRFTTSVSLLTLSLLFLVSSAASQTNASFVLKKTSTKTYATARVTADLNGDGIPDLIEPYARITPGVLFSVQLGLGNGYFAAPVDYSGNINHQYGDVVLTADVNRDGKADVIFISGKDLLVYLGRGDGTLLPPQQYSFNDFVQLAGVGDFNHDGNPDLVLAFANNVSVAFGNGTGAFGAPTSVLIIGPTQGIGTMALGDFDGDANLDIALGLSNQPCNPGGCASTDVNILYGDGAGSFADRLVYAGVPGDLLFASGDLNNDGKSDLVAQLGQPNSMGENALALYGQVSRAVTAEYLSTNGHYAFGTPQAIADFNGDGYNDVALMVNGAPGAPNDEAIGILLRGANNSFTLQEIDFGQAPSDQGNLLIGDFNRDGVPDFLFTASDNTDTIFNVFDYINTTGPGSRTRCEYPSAAAGISTCIYRSGTNGATVTFGAAASWFEPLRKLELWIDGKKVNEQYNVWDKYAWLMSSASTFSNGTHRADLYTAGYDNALQHQTLTFKVPGPSCTPPSSPGVNVCSPVAGTVGRSVEALAAGTISGTIRRMEVWIDGTKMYTTFGSNMLDTTLTVAPGSHTFTFYIVNTSGQVLSKSVQVTVK
jgi:hypothetical protein